MWPIGPGFDQFPQKVKGIIFQFLRFGQGLMRSAKGLLGKTNLHPDKIGKGRIILRVKNTIRTIKPLLSFPIQSIQTCGNRQASYGRIGASPPRQPPPNLLRLVGLTQEQMGFGTKMIQLAMRTLLARKGRRDV